MLESDNLVSLKQALATDGAFSVTGNTQKTRTINIQWECHAQLLRNIPDNKEYLFLSVVCAGTALFGKVYRTIFQSKRRRLVFKTGFNIYIHNDTY